MRIILNCQAIGRLAILIADRYIRPVQQNFIARVRMIARGCIDKGSVSQL
jgi:hypothetical protein